MGVLRGDGIYMGYIYMARAYAGQPILVYVYCMYVHVCICVCMCVCFSTCMLCIYSFHHKLVSVAIKILIG